MKNEYLDCLKTLVDTNMGENGEAKGDLQQ